MPTVLLFLFNILRAFIDILRIMMFLRAILSWFPDGRNSSFSQFCIAVTEPVIAPVRYLVSRIPSLARMPFDIAFLITFIILSML